MRSVLAHQPLEIEPLQISQPAVDLQTMNTRINAYCCNWVLLQVFIIDTEPKKLTEVKKNFPSMTQQISAYSEIHTLVCYTLSRLLSLLYSSVGCEWEKILFMHLLFHCPLQGTIRSPASWMVLWRQCKEIYFSLMVLCVRADSKWGDCIYLLSC